MCISFWQLSDSDHQESVNVYPTDVLDQEQSLLLGGYTVSLPTFPLLGFTALRQVERRMNVTARHREKREKTYRIKTNNQEELIRKQNESDATS